MATLLEQVLVFILVFLAFLPLTAKTVRLVTRTIENRENLPKESVRRVLISSPLILLLGFAIFYLILIAVLDIIVL
ncbi:MAG: hypothetical protein IH840_06850 [Candidatus Heimdallarchaeota archaeon]|nr:hypothetical protein [Candidatus Heimdallarchaeota archaeon]